MRLLDLAGKSFGRLTAQWPSGRKGKIGRSVYWLCSCECGKLKVVAGTHLRLNRIRSCGCLHDENGLTSNLQHGMSGTREYIMWKMAKYRAAKKGMEYNISLGDVFIPERCPLLDIPLSITNGVLSDDSPTLDRIDNSKGYVEGNVWVISSRANTVKRDLDLPEMELLVRNWKLAIDRNFRVLADGFDPR